MVEGKIQCKWNPTKNQGSEGRWETALCLPPCSKKVGLPSDCSAYILYKGVLDSWIELSVWCWFLFMWALSSKVQQIKDECGLIPGYTVGAYHCLSWFLRWSPSAGSFSALLHKLPDGMSKETHRFIPSVEGIWTFKVHICYSIFTLVSKYTKSSYSSAKMHRGKSANPSSGY